MLIFNKIEIENFLSYGSKQSLNFQTQGVHLINGENMDSITHIDSDGNEKSGNSGSGKSSLPLAIQFALFGEVIKKKKLPKEKVINKKFKKNLKVALEFTKDSDKYRIERYRKHSKHANSVFLFKWIEDTWQDISQTDIAFTQNLIDNLIIINSSTFLKSILFARDDQKNFLELSGQERTEIFENIIQLNKFKDYFFKVKDKLKDVSKLIAVNSMQAEASTQVLRLTIKNIWKELKTKREQIKIIKREISKLEDIAGNNIEKLIQDIVELEKLESDLLNKSNLQETLNNTITKKSLEVSKLANQHKTIKSRLDVLNERLKNHTPETCKNCGENLDAEKFEKHKLEIETDIESTNKDFDLLKESLKNLLLEKKELEAEYASNIEPIASLENLINELKTNDVKSVRKQFGSDTVTKLNSILTEIKLAQQKLDFINDDRILQLIQEGRGHQNKLKTEKNILDECNREKELLDFWESALDFKNENSIKQFIISKIIPVFNTILAENVFHVYGDTLKVNFDNFFNENIIYNGEDYDYWEFSTGEANKVNICINLSILDITRINLTGSNILFLDEIFTSLDEVSIAKFLGLINERYVPKSAVYIISHDKGVKEILNPSSLITIRKENGESQIL